MKTATIIAAFLFVSAAASAQENYAGNTDFTSTKTRAEVKAELRIAQQRGEVVSGEQYPGAVLDAAVKGKTRAEVKAELAAYRKTQHETDYSSL